MAAVIGPLGLDKHLCIYLFLVVLSGLIEK